jgi:hypothetical protein
MEACKNDGHPPRLLVAIFSFERFVELRNLLRSIEQQMGDVDLYVFDDNSSNPCVGKFLESMEVNGRLRWERSDSDASGKGRLGGLYHNLNRALSVGIEEEYDLLLLLQDDHQILWFEQDIVQKTFDFFRRHEDALMLDPRFIRRIQFHASYAASEMDAAISMRRGAIAVGFIAPWRAEKIGFRFGRTERESSDIALALGKRCFKSRLPFVADIPVVASFHCSRPFFQGHLWYDADRERFVDNPILKPLSQSDLQMIKAVPKHSAIFAEDVVRRADGRPALYPHSFNTSLFSRYRVLTLSAWWAELCRGNRIRRLPPLSSLVLHKRSRWTAFIRRKQQTSRLWSYGIYIVDTAKTALFFLFLYRLIGLWMRRESRKFMRQLQSGDA